jgi:hypothetical protein
MCRSSLNREFLHILPINVTLGNIVDASLPKLLEESNRLLHPRVASPPSHASAVEPHPTFVGSFPLSELEEFSDAHEEGLPATPTEPRLFSFDQDIRSHEDERASLEQWYDSSPAPESSASTTTHYSRVDHGHDPAIMNVELSIMKTLTRMFKRCLPGPRLCMIMHTTCLIIGILAAAYRDIVYLQSAHDERYLNHQTFICIDMNASLSTVKIIAGGDTLPRRHNHVSMEIDILSGASRKTITLHTVPGALSPTCSAQSFSSVLVQYDALIAEAGADEICYECVEP